MKLRYAAQTAAVALVAGLLILLGLRLAAAERGAALVAAFAAGHRPSAPDFTLPRLDRNGTLRLSSLRGRIVVLNFWASWCVPCKSEAPLLQATWRQSLSHGVVVLGIDAQDFTSDAHDFIRRYKLTYPNVRDGSGATTSRYGVSGFPETWLVDRRGHLVAEHIVGPTTAARIAHDISLASNQ